MTKKVELPERFVLASIKYKCGCKGFGYAPTSSIHVGDTVKTEVDEGTVVSIASWCTPEDEYFKVLCDVDTVDKITHKIVEVKE